MNKKKRAEIESHSPNTKENRKKKVMVSLGGTAITEDGKLTKSNYFRFLDLNLDEYDDIMMTKAQAKKIHHHLVKLSTGASAMTPMFCAGALCQPAGSMIRTANRGDVRIEDIVPEDKLWAYDRRAASIRNSGYNSRLEKKPFDGNIFSIDTGEESYSCTGEHLVISKWNKKAKNSFCVYLMEKNGSFRVGKTKLFMNSNGRWRFGPGCRMRCEKADAIWILDIFDTNTNALLAEEYYSVMWQIPKSLFLETKKYNQKYKGLYKWVTQDQLDFHHRLMRKPRMHYTKLLAQHGLSINIPFKVSESVRCKCNSIKNNKYGGGNSVFEIAAFNFMSGYMDVPVVPDKVVRIGKRWPVEWKLANKDIKSYKGMVYSLDVDQHHTYVTNNIVTHNCPIAERCPLVQMRNAENPSERGDPKHGKAPVGRQCIIETQLMKEWITRYFEEFDVDPNNFTEVGYISELADLMVLEMRINMNLSKPENASLLIDQTVGVDRDGDAIVQKIATPFIEMKERIATRRSKIITLMVGDRREKYKMEAALKIKIDSDPSTEHAEMRARLENLKRELDNASKDFLQSSDGEKQPEIPGALTPEDLIASDE